MTTPKNYAFSRGMMKKTSRHQHMGVIFLASVLVIFFAAPKAFAWGKRGHDLVAKTAALLLANQGSADAAFLKESAFDLGYYANVPDLIWKRPATYPTELPQHFMDMEIYERGLKDSTVAKPFELTRSEFDQKFPQIPNSAGRSWWRIRELTGILDSTAVVLRSPELKDAKRKEAQARWLMLAGVISHYVGDLAQPLHTTENYDGQMNGQKGLHAYFETVVVNELPRELDGEVMARASRLWAEYSKAHAGDSVLEILRQLTADSHAHIGDLLALDKKIGRQDLAVSVGAYHDFIVERLSAGSLALAEIWRRELGWHFDDDKFYNFDESPEYIEPK